MLTSPDILHIKLLFPGNTLSAIEEAGLFWYEKCNSQVQPHNTLKESLVAWKRGIFRLSQYIPLGKTIRWMAEKLYSLYSTSRPAISRNMAMTTDIHTLWPLDQERTDILQEYFIPPPHTSKFIRILKKSI
ncbi:MAG: hypothetical protein ACK5PQ_04125 [Alphaproteobacteria bacterium]